MQQSKEHEITLEPTEPGSTLVKDGARSMNKMFLNGFYVKPINERMFIFGGPAGTGKSFFSRKIDNSVVVEDITRGSKETQDRITKAVWEFECGRVDRFKQYIDRAPDNWIMIFIVNDPQGIPYVRDIVNQTMNEIRKIWKG